jgi:hypothetical protein
LPCQAAIAWPIWSGESSWTTWLPSTVTSVWVGQARQDSRCAPTRVALRSASMNSVARSLSASQSGRGLNDPGQVGALAAERGLHGQVRVGGRASPMPDRLAVDRHLAVRSPRREVIGAAHDDQVGRDAVPRL